jgi:hypothetical protein
VPIAPERATSKPKRVVQYKDEAPVLTCDVCGRRDATEELRTDTDGRLIFAVCGDAACRRSAAATVRWWGNAFAVYLSSETGRLPK